MSEIDPTHRIRSGLSIGLPDGWAAVDALEVHSPDGIVLSVTSYPIDPTIDALGLANLDEPNGLEPVEEVELPDLFGGLGGVARRYDSEESEGVTQLAAFSVLSGRGIVARATAPTQTFAEQESALWRLLETAAVLKPAQELEAPAQESAVIDQPTSLFHQYFSGIPGLAELPNRSAGAPEQVETADQRPLLISGDELTALARLHGVAGFPGVAAPEDQQVASTLERSMRSVLVARGFARFPDTETLVLPDRIRRLVTTAMQTDMVVDAAVVNDGISQRRLYFSREGPTMVLHALPGGIFRCEELDSAAVVDHVLDLMDLGDSESVAEAESFTIDPAEGLPESLGTPESWGEVQVTKVEGDDVVHEIQAWLAFAEHGVYTRTDDTTWEPIDAATLLDRISTSVVDTASGSGS